MKAFDEKGRRWYRPTNVEMVVGWAQEREFQRLLRLPLQSWERGYFGTEEQVLEQMERDRRVTERLRALIPPRLKYLRSLLTVYDHEREGSVAALFSCGEPGCPVCVGDVR